MDADQMSSREIAGNVDVSRSTVGRHLPRAKAKTGQSAKGAATSVAQEARERRVRRQRALDVERGLFWKTIFDVLPNTASWNATKARNAGPTSVFCHEFPFFSRLDGKYYAWPSPQRLARDFPPTKTGDRGLDAFRCVVLRTAKLLERQGMPYVPLAFRESVFSAAVAASSRFSIADPRLAPPPAIFCPSLRKDVTGWENPWRFGESPWGAYGLRRVEERGLVVIASRDLERRVDSTRKAVIADLLDDGVGVAITATPSNVTIASRVGPIPALERLPAPDAPVVPSQSVIMREYGIDSGEHAHRADAPGARPTLTAVLRWALECGPELTALGYLSLVVAEAQADGNTVLPELGAFLDHWSARQAPPDPAGFAAVLDLAASGDLASAEHALAALTSPLPESRLALVAIIEPSGTRAEEYFASKATCTFEFLPDEGIDRSSILNPEVGISKAHLKAIRRALRSDKPLRRRSADERG